MKRNTILILLTATLTVLINTQITSAQGGFINIGGLWDLVGKPLASDLFSIIKLIAVLGSIIGYAIVVFYFFNNLKKEDVKDNCISYLFWITVAAFFAFFAKEILSLLPFFKDYIG